MNNKNHLSYFLNSMKDELDFSDAEDFKDKVHLKENLDLELKFKNLFIWPNILVGKIHIATICIIMDHIRRH